MSSSKCQNLTIRLNYYERKYIEQEAEKLNLSRANYTRFMLGIKLSNYKRRVTTKLEE